MIDRTDAEFAARKSILKSRKFASTYDIETEYGVVLQNGKWRELFVYHAGTLVEFDASLPAVSGEERA